MFSVLNIFELETILLGPLPNLDNDYSFLATKFICTAQNSNKTSFLCECFDLNGERQLSVKYTVDTRLGCLFQLMGGVQFFPNFFFKLTYIILRCSH